MAIISSVTIYNLGHWGSERWSDVSKVNEALAEELCEPTLLDSKANVPSTTPDSSASLPMIRFNMAIENAYLKIYNWK